MPSTEDLNKKVVKQVEFYLSDYNLPFDKFLYTLHSEKDGNWIPIETLASFKKMKMITEDLDAIKKALKEHTSDLYEINEEGDKIRRKTELVELDLEPRTVHAKGFPLVDADIQDNNEKKEALMQLQDEIEAFFGEKGTVRLLRLKHELRKPRHFKGSAYITFETEEEAKSVADLKEVTFKDNKITLMHKPAYIAMKAEEYKDKPREGPKAFRSFNIFKIQRYEAKNGNQTAKRGLEDAAAEASEAKKTKTDA